MTAATACVDGPAQRRDRSAFLLRNLAPAFALALVLVSLEATRLDTAVTGWFYDAAARAFPLRYDSFLEVVAHQWAKGVVIAVAVIVIALLGLSFVIEELRPRRRLLLYLALALTLAPLAVALLKAASARHCPWSLAEYGGFAPHLTLFDPVPAGLAAGHCFPAGHASTGFCLLAFHFAGRAMGSRALARAGLALGIGAGLLLGAGRVAQGAHFVSHVLWSGIVCWSVIVIIYTVVMLPRPAASTVAAP